MDIIGVHRPEGLSKLSQGVLLRVEGDWDFPVGARLCQACKGSSYSQPASLEKILGGQEVG